MKKVFGLMCVIVAVILASCGYSKEDVETARKEGYDQGYADAEYYLQPDIWDAEENAAERGYEYGYEIGYDDGYYDCLEEHGLVESTFDPDNPPRIEKDRD